MRRELVAEIGNFDEQFGLGNWEDNDLCHRARRSGWALYIAKSVFVHHTGGQSFRALGIDYNKSLADGQRLFEQKWSVSNGG
jgi:GT2 family glycosyltransferase